MQILHLPISEITPAPYNPRISLEPGSDEHRRLVRSLTEFDLVQPLVWNRRSGHLVGGHQRFAILRDRGDETVPVVAVDLSPEREKALNITLNNRDVGGDWDAAKLIDLVGELAELPDFDATLTGFDAEVIDDLLFLPDPEPVSEPSSDPDHNSNSVRITLRMSSEVWTRVREPLDRLIGDHAIEAHVENS